MIATAQTTPLRRDLLRWAALAACAGTLPRWAISQAAQQPFTRTDPFALGVASGEPTAQGCVLWTRLLPIELDAARAPATVRWEVAHDPGFRQIVQHGHAPALPALGHSVHVEVQGLAPARWYYYRFMLGDATSATGRTCTAPTADALPAALRLAFASCQRWEHGHYAAWRHLVADAPDLVLFLGDYIYEYASPRDTTGLARTHTLRHARDLADLRDRYALYKSDPALQAAHAACPWLVTWDDHEVQNDYAADRGRGDSPEERERFAALRSAGWQAFYENMPLRAATLRDGSYRQLQIYRSTAWGRLARLHLLDTRQYRDWQACRAADQANAGAVRPEQCPTLAHPERTLLGTAQEQWLDNQLAADASDGHGRHNGNSALAARPWSVIAQQTLFSPRRYPSGVQSTDSWDGYPGARARLQASIARHTPGSTVLLGGDIHQNYVCRVPAPVGAADAMGSIAAEFCGTSISSQSGARQAQVDAIARHNPHVLLARCEERGYGLADITPRRWTTTLRAVIDPLRADSDARTLARFEVQPDLQGPQPL